MHSDLLCVGRAAPQRLGEFPARAYGRNISISLVIRNPRYLKVLCEERAANIYLTNSIGQSSGLLNRRFGVQVPGGVPDTLCA